MISRVCFKTKSVIRLSDRLNSKQRAHLAIWNLWQFCLININWILCLNIIFKSYIYILVNWRWQRIQWRKYDHKLRRSHWKWFHWVTWRISVFWRVYKRLAFPIKIPIIISLTSIKIVVIPSSVIDCRTREDSYYHIFYLWKCFLVRYWESLKINSC